MTKENGYAALMTPYTWMFISRHEKLRQKIVEKGTISSLIQLEYSAFEDAVVPLCTFVLQNQKINSIGIYVKLTEFKGGMDVQDNKVKEACRNKECRYLFEVDQANFERISGMPISYWVSQKVFSIFKEYPRVSNFVQAKAGIVTGKDENFLRHWSEVNMEDISLINNESEIGKVKYVPIADGGEYQKYYGNIGTVIAISKLWDDSKVTKSVRRGDRFSYYKKAISWSLVTSGSPSFKIFENFVFSTPSPEIIVKNDKDFHFILGYMNTSVVKQLVKIMNPTINLPTSYVTSLPIPITVEEHQKIVIKQLVENNIYLSIVSWTSFEISWDFKQHPLITYKESTQTISKAFYNWKDITKKNFEKLKANDEELNRIFIEIYGLQDELTHSVEDKDITVRKADLTDDVKSFLSYLVGVIFGRYSLDEPGLIYAGGEFNRDRYEKYKPDKDNIIPITDEHYFEDDIVTKIIELVKIIFGEQSVEENVQFIAEALGMKNNENSRDTIRRYFMKDFFKDHKKIYQNRPIYWQMTSGKQDAFKGLIYLHRYESTTLARVRTDYVLPLTNTITELMRQAQLVIDGSGSSKEVAKAQKTKEKYQKQLQELRDYDLILKNLADQEIDLELDDGVKVNYEKFQNVPVIGTSNQRMTKMNLFEKI